MQFKEVKPTSKALDYTQDRLNEKQLLNSLGIETADFCEVSNLDDLENAGKSLGFPFFLKTRCGGYDGKGQWKVTENDNLEEILESAPTRNLIAEKAINFDREVSMVAVRNSEGEFKFFDICENVHDNGILHNTRNMVNDPYQKMAEEKISKLMDHLEYCGVLTLEFFQSEGDLLANEYAPRVHNSGHWTIEGTVTSQFESHMRAVSGLPLESVANKGNFLMYNLIGGVPEELKADDFNDGVLHDYLKAPRPGRKAGHLTLELKSTEDYSEKLKKFDDIMKSSGL